MASQISDVSHQTYKLLDDLLTWSKSQLGQLAPRPVKVNLYKLADKAFAQMTILAKKKNISLINDAQKNAHVKADPDMLEFVVRNLIHNALMFTPPGGVVRFYEVAEGQAITFYVEDTGIGIQPAKVKDIFSLSGNLSTARTSEEAGTGLGLMLSRELVEMNNGTISVKSEPGGGACFMVSLDKSDN
jgi:signal transduction histidine kinase